MRWRALVPVAAVAAALTLAVGAAATFTSGAGASTAFTSGAGGVAVASATGGVAVSGALEGAVAGAAGAGSSATAVVTALAVVESTDTMSPRPTLARRNATTETITISKAAPPITRRWRCACVARVLDERAHAPLVTADLRAELVRLVRALVQLVAVVEPARDHVGEGKLSGGRGGSAAVLR